MRCSRAATFTSADAGIVVDYIAQVDSNVKLHTMGQVNVDLSGAPSHDLLDSSPPALPIANAHSTAFTTLANSATMPSPAVSIPRRAAVGARARAPGQWASISMDKLEETCAEKIEAPAAGEGATPEGSGEVAAAEAKAADTREAVAAKIDVD